MKRRFDELVKSFSEELERKFGGSRSTNGSQSTTNKRMRSGLGRMFSQKSFSNNRANTQEIDEEAARFTDSGSIVIEHV